jgi:hypothetical protein
MADEQHNIFTKRVKEFFEDLPLAALLSEEVQLNRDSERRLLRFHFNLAGTSAEPCGEDPLRAFNRAGAPFLLIGNSWR